MLEESPARYSATERLRELTQEVSDIGDEVATYIDNIGEALADWDEGLADDCREECDIIVREAREDIRSVTPELVGIRRALTSGLKSGVLSAGAGVRERSGRPMSGLREEPRAVTVDSLTTCFPIPTVVDADAVNAALVGRTQLVAQLCSDVADWVEYQTNMATDDPSSTNLSIVFARAYDHVVSAIGAWKRTVALPYPPFTRMMHGTCPPPFLEERARIDRIVSSVASRRQGGHFAS
ncbi:hypothetical protein ACGE24_00650 [Corynebacterium kroppenstedtii]|uniref:hypothetical protein n=1 Tax=Corynebacterium sp. PCR 32 TaxID=3351342 RepID=UPI0030B35DEA